MTPLEWMFTVGVILAWACIEICRRNPTRLPYPIPGPGGGNRDDTTAEAPVPDCTNPAGGHRFPACSMPGEPARGRPCIHCGLRYPVQPEEQQ